MAAKALTSFAAAAPRRLSAAVFRPSPLLRRLPLLAAPSSYLARLSIVPATRCFSSRPTTSSLNDPSPNWSNRPPKETILLDGCDFEHWLIVMEAPAPDLTRDEIIDSYIKTLAQVVGSEDEARKSIYSVSTKHYFAFGCIVSEELSYKIKPLPNVRWVLPDSYLDVKNKDYGGEPFIDGQAVPYDPKYHEEWVRNNARAMERNRRNDRPRNFDRSRNFERRRENAQNFQNRDAPPMQSQGFQNRDTQGGMPSHAPQMQPSNQSPPQNVNAGPPGGVPNFQNQMPNAQRGFTPNAGTGYQGNAPPYQGGGAPGATAPSGPAYQGSSQQYQGNSQAYQGNSQPYQGGNPPYQGSGPAASTYQGGGQSYQGPNAGYNQQGGQSGYHGGPAANYNNPQGPSGYQRGAPSYQGGNQSDGYQGSGGYQPSGYQGGNPGYQQGRDIPGRDQ